MNETKRSSRRADPGENTDCLILPKLGTEVSKKLHNRVSWKYYIQNNVLFGERTPENCSIPKNRFRCPYLIDIECSKKER